MPSSSLWAGKEPALPPPENPAPDESAVRPPEGETQALWYWKDLWDSPETRRLELDYAQSFSVDFSAGGYARIRIDQETYLLCPDDYFNLLSCHLKNAKQ